MGGEGGEIKKKKKKFEPECQALFLVFFVCAMSPLPHLLDLITSLATWDTMVSAASGTCEC